jgi:hypothetical protein
MCPDINNIPYDFIVILLSPETNASLFHKYTRATR